jgi:roadblock/LC7 domain-containing protein
VSEFDELISLDGIIMAGRFDADWHIAEQKSAALLLANPVTLQMAQWFCAAVSSMFNSMASAVDSVHETGTFDRSSWMPLKSWTFSGGDYVIAVDGKRFVIAETMKLRSFDELIGVLHAGGS